MDKDLYLAFISQVDPTEWRMEAAWWIVLKSRWGRIQRTKFSNKLTRVAGFSYNDRVYVSASGH